MWLKPGQTIITLPIGTEQVRAIRLRTPSHAYALAPLSASDFDSLEKTKDTPVFFYFDSINRRLHLAPTPKKRFSMSIELLVRKMM
jgi:hypothetical protein